MRARRRIQLIDGDPTLPERFREWLRCEQSVFRMLDILAMRSWQDPELVVIGLHRLPGDLASELKRMIAQRVREAGGEIRTPTLLIRSFGTEFRTFLPMDGNHPSRLGPVQRDAYLAPKPDQVVAQDATVA
jgi:hypothetical protein